MKNKILYIHGLSSSGASSTAQKLRENLPDFNVLSPDLPIHPDEALALLHSVCEAEKPQILIGTSMGGMFAQQIRGFKKILVNPAFHVSDIMRTQPGPHPFLSPRQDGETTYTITPELCEAYRETEANQFTNITDFDRENTYALVGTYDTLVHGYNEYIRHYRNAAWFEGEHRLNLKNIQTVVIPLIRQM